MYVCMYKGYSASVCDKRQGGILLVILSEKFHINIPVTTNKNTWLCLSQTFAIHLLYHALQVKNKCLCQKNNTKVRYPFSINILCSLLCPTTSKNYSCTSLLYVKRDVKIAE